MKLCWKFYGNINFKVVLFGLWLSFSALNGAEADCNYFQNLKAGETYYVYNPNYPDVYKGKNDCAWQMRSPYVTKINCSIDMPSNNCAVDKLTFQSEGKNDARDICDYRNYVFEGTNPIISFNSSRNTKGGTFLCEIRTEKEWDKYNCDCGWKKVTRIVGGKETGVNEYPMMCGLANITKEEREMIYCGCTIISQQYVITAAHCIEGEDLREINAVIGEHDVTTGYDTNATKLFRLAECVIHPGYNQKFGYSENPHNDLAVCKISGSIKYSAEVGPVCLPFQHNRDSFGGDIVTAMGWGLTEFAGDYKPTALQGVDLNVMALENCKNYFPNIINSSNLCTFTQGKDACQMDSGGPLLWEDPTTHNLVLVGIMSGGAGCGSVFPSVAMRVGAYIDWIISLTPDVQYCQVE